MVIKPSSAREVDRLIADLTSGTDLQRESAVARLAVIGGRAVGRLLEVVRTAEAPAVKAAALQALETSGDVRSLEAALALLATAEPAVAEQAVSLARRFLTSSHGARVVDSLTALAFDSARPSALRLTALEALADMPARTVQPVWQRLVEDEDPAVRRRARLALGLRETEPPPREVLEAAAAGSLPDAAPVLKAALASAGQETPLPTLHGILEAIRDRERSVSDPRDAVEWRQARGTLHRMLAERGSTVALYDLRETIEQAAPPLSADFVAALALAGDHTCLDAIAASFARTAGSAAGYDWWRSQLASAFQQIVHREGLTGRHAAIKRVRAKWPEVAVRLLGPPHRR